MPSRRACRQTQPWMAECSRHAVSGGPEAEANVRREGTGNPGPPEAEANVRREGAGNPGPRRRRQPPFFFGGVNLSFLMSSTISPFCFMPETAVTAFTVSEYLSP